MKKGQALVEVMVGLGIAAALMPAIVSSFFAARGGTASEQVRMQANARLRESRELLRLIKESAWSNLETNGTYHLTSSGGVWSLAPGPESGLDGLFNRQIIIADAYRDLNNQLSIIQSGNTVDPSVKHITTTVSWTSPSASSVISDYYLMRLENIPWIQTTVADFTAGIQTGTAVVNVSGGEIVLGSGGSALSDWCAPSLTLATADLPKNGVANAIHAQVGVGTNPNQILTGTGDNSSGISLAHLNVTNASAPVPTIDGTFDGYKTNDVFVQDNYAYIATDNNQREVVIVDLLQRDANGKFLEVGYYNVDGNGNGMAVAATPTLGYVLSGSKLYSFDLKSKVGSREALTNQNLMGVGSEMEVSGDYVFVSESTGTRPLEVVKVESEGKSMSTVAWSTISGQNATDLMINSTHTRAYLATSQGKVYIINMAGSFTGLLPPPIGTYDTGGMTPKGITVVTNNKAIVVGVGGTLQYQVIDIENETNPVLCTHSGQVTGGLTISNGVNGISSVQEEDGDTYSYIITGDATSELKIIQGGGGGGGGTYTSSGSFESSIFDASHSAMFNRFDVTAVVPPPDTGMTYQVAIADAVSGSCAGSAYNFVGPDKTSNTFFTNSSSLPLGSVSGYTNPGRCLKYKIFMTTANSNNSPVLYDITFNYSP